MQNSADFPQFLSTSVSILTNDIFGSCSHIRQREASKTDDPNILLLSNCRVYLLARSINVMVASIVLTLPIVVLYWLAEMKFRLLALTAFTFLFSALLCGFTKSRNYEIFSATAA